jgi:hypothetical protein
MPLLISPPPMRISVCVRVGYPMGYRPSWLFLTANTSIRIQGFLYACAYFVNEDMLQQWRMFLKEKWKFLTSLCVTQRPESGNMLSSVDSSMLPPSNLSSVDQSMLINSALWDNLIPSDMSSVSTESNLAKAPWGSRDVWSKDVPLSQDRERLFLLSPNTRHGKKLWA